jgi:hypothetical protein
MSKEAIIYITKIDRERLTKLILRRRHPLQRWMSH